MQLLPWDFRTCFPEPKEEAIEAGRLNEDDVAIDNLRSLHEEHARHALTLLADLDAILDSRRLAVGPQTRTPPRTPKQRERLQKLFADEPARLEREFEVLMDVYEDAFGSDAADAFRKAIRAWHAGVDVISEKAPSPSPLPNSVAAGVFGTKECGSIVNPSDEEIHAITEQLTEELLALPAGSKREELLSKYAEDFGPDAARELDRWSSLKSESEELGAAEYDAGHPWHYYHEGDGADPIPPQSIPPHTTSLESLGVKWPKNPAKRRALAQQMLTGQRVQLAEDEQRYRDLIDNGVEALNRYDREIAHGSNDDLAWASAVALKFTHIGHARGRIKCLEQALGIPDRA